MFNISLEETLDYACEKNEAFNCSLDLIDNGSTIKVKEDPKNITKSVKRRIRSKVELLKGLTPDQYNILLSQISEISKNSSRISYRQPEYECKKCHTKIDEVEMSAQNMLFTRHQLALIKNLSIE